jgi:tetratricopeptide (TPR) repeat protein
MSRIDHIDEVLGEVRRYLAHGQLAHALALLTDVLGGSDKEVHSLAALFLERAKILHRIGEYDLALADCTLLETVDGLTPPFASAVTHLVAQLYWSRFEKQQAIAYLAKSLETQPRDLVGLLLLANWCRELCDLDRATGIYTRVLALEKEVADRHHDSRTVDSRKVDVSMVEAALLGRAWCYYQASLFDQALLDLNQLQIKKADLFSMLYLRGLCYLGKKCADAALADFTGCLLLREDPEAFFYRAQARMLECDCARAMQDLNLALSLAPRRAKYFIERARILIYLKNFGLALEELSLAIRYDAANQEAYRMRSGVLRTLGRVGEAESDVAEIRRQQLGKEGIQTNNRAGDVYPENGSNHADYYFILPLLEDLQGVFDVHASEARVLLDDHGAELFEYKVAFLPAALAEAIHNAHCLRVQPVAHLDRQQSLECRPFIFVRPLASTPSAVYQLARHLSLLIRRTGSPVFVHRAGLLHSAEEWNELMSIHDQSVALFNLLCSVEVTTAWPLGVRSQGMASLGLPDILILSGSDEEYVVQAVVRAAVDSIKRKRGHERGESLELPASPRSLGIMECRELVCEGYAMTSSFYNPHGWTVIGSSQQLHRFEGGDVRCSSLISNLRSRSLRARKAAVQGLADPMFALEPVREAFRRVLRDAHVPIRLLALVVMESFSLDTARLYLEELLWLQRSGEELVASTAFELLDRLRNGSRTEAKNLLDASNL